MRSGRLISSAPAGGCGRVGGCHRPGGDGGRHGAAAIAQGRIDLSHPADQPPAACPLRMAVKAMARQTFQAGRPIPHS
jgi:hypothetical protein